MIILSFSCYSVPKQKTVHKSINEIKSSVVEVPHPIFEYNDFKILNAFVKLVNCLGNLDLLFSGKIKYIKQ